MTVFFALASALFSATNLLTQRVSSSGGPSGNWRKLISYLVQQKLWLIGVAADVGAFLMQAIALHLGKLSVVQPLLVTELVFVLLLRRLWLRQHVRALAWGAAVLTCGGLVVFLVAGQPQGGQPEPKSSAWLGALIVFVGITAVLTLLGTRGSPVRRAALYGAAAAVTGALGAAFLTATVAILARDGILAMVTDWPLYALIVASAGSVVLVQAALHVGPLSVSQPIMVVLNPVFSIWLSVWLFAEFFSHDPLVLAVAAAGFLAMVGGVVLLTRTAPQTA